MRKEWVLGLLLVVPFGSAVAGGRPDKIGKNWFGHFGGGFSMAQGDVENILDDEVYFNGGATYWPDDWAAGVDLDFSFSNYEFSREALDAINDEITAGGAPGEVTGGDVNVWGLNASGVWSPFSKNKGLYVLGGVGMYYVDAVLTDEGIVYYPPVCDPWYWWCYPGGVGPGTFVTDHESSVEFGWNGGIGFSFEVGMEGAQVYLEARYQSIEMEHRTSDFLPLTIGYRW
jgi:hypothetical protein